MYAAGVKKSLVLVPGTSWNFRQDKHIFSPNVLRTSKKFTDSLFLLDKDKLFGNRTSKYFDVLARETSENFQIFLPLMPKKKFSKKVWMWCQAGWWCYFSWWGRPGGRGSGDRRNMRSRSSAPSSVRPTLDTGQFGGLFGFTMLGWLVVSPDWPLSLMLRVQFHYLRLKTAKFFL